MWGPNVSKVFFVFVSSPFFISPSQKKYTRTLNIPKIKDYIAFPFGLGYRGRFLGAHYQIQYGAIGNKWELEKHTGSIIENHWELYENTLQTHWEQGGNTKIQKKSQNQPYTRHPSRPSHWMHEISIPKLFVTNFGLGSYPFLRTWIPNIFFAIFCQKNPKNCPQRIFWILSLPKWKFQNSYATTLFTQTLTSVTKRAEP